MTSFPSLWSVIDEPTGRVICELDNPMRDPGDGTIISATNISIVTYAGDGQWCRQEDIYNPLRFVSATGSGAAKPQELGTLPDEAAAWLRQFGEPQMSAKLKLVIGANGFLGTHVTRQLVADGGTTSATMVREGANTDRHRRPDGHAVRRRHLERRHAARGDDAAVDDVYYCVVDTRGWLRDPAPLFRTNVDGTRNVLEVAERLPACEVCLHQQLRHRRPQARPRRHRGRHHRRPRADAVCAVAGAGRETRDGVRAASTACPPLRCACQRPTAAATGAAPRTARSSPARRSASCRS